MASSGTVRVSPCHPLLQATSPPVVVTSHRQLPPLPPRHPHHHLPSLAGLVPAFSNAFFLNCSERSFLKTNQIVFNLLSKLLKQNKHAHCSLRGPDGASAPAPATLPSPHDLWSPSAFAEFLDQKGVSRAGYGRSRFSIHSLFAELTLLSFRVSSGITSPEGLAQPTSPTRSPTLPSVHCLNPTARLFPEALNMVAQ